MKRIKYNRRFVNVGELRCLRSWLSEHTIALKGLGALLMKSRARHVQYQHTDIGVSVAVVGFGKKKARSRAHKQTLPCPPTCLLVHDNFL